jgi:hypothetical protein
MKKSALFVLSGIVFSLSAFAAEVSGVKLDDQITVGTSPLVLNGAGLRTKFGLAKVYVAGLYVPQKSGEAAGIIGLQQPRRVVMVMKRDVSADTMLEAFHKGLSANLSEAELQALKPRLDQLDQVFHAVGQAREHDVIDLDFGADGSVRISFNGKPTDQIQGPDIGPAMLKIWLGEHPVQDSLKDALLGKD